MTEATGWPAGACDTHVHVYDGRFPIAPAAVLRPADASVADYRAVQRSLGLDRVVFVQPTTYGLDNRCQLEAAAALGEAARLVVVVDEETTDEELARLDAAGARGARFHMLPGGAVGWESLQPVATRIADLGWHIQLQLDGRELTDRIDDLQALPCPLVVDHIGRFMPPVASDHPSFRALVRLLDDDRTWVKLSAPYEASLDPSHAYDEMGDLARALVAHRPDRVLWASNWPHPGQDHPPSPTDLHRLLHAWVEDPATRRAILVDNPAVLYGFTDGEPR